MILLKMKNCLILVTRVISLILVAPRRTEFIPHSAQTLGNLAALVNGYRQLSGGFPIEEGGHDSVRLKTQLPDTVKCLRADGLAKLFFLLLSPHVILLKPFCHFVPR